MAPPPSRWRVLEDRRLKVDVVNVEDFGLQTREVTLQNPEGAVVREVRRVICESGGRTFANLGEQVEARCGTCKDFIAKGEMLRCAVRGEILCPRCVRFLNDDHEEPLCRLHYWRRIAWLCLHYTLLLPVISLARWALSWFVEIETPAEPASLENNERSEDRHPGQRPAHKSQPDAQRRLR